MRPDSIYTSASSRGVSRGRVIPATFCILALGQVRSQEKHGVAWVAFLGWAVDPPGIFNANTI